jgi:predicted dehydrogenase
MNDSQPSPFFLNRREFIRKSAWAGAAGLSLGTILHGDPANTANNALAVGVVGTGAQGQVLLNCLKNIPGIRVVALCDIWDYNLKKGLSAIRATGQKPNTYERVEDMLAAEGSLDAVIVATPDFWHAPHTIACLEAGKHVYCEKMMSNTLDGARRMVQAARKSGKLLQIGHQRRSNPRYRFVLDRLLRKNALCGRIINVNGQWNRSLSRSQDLSIAKPSLILPNAKLQEFGFANMHQFLNWRWYRDLSGGPISDLGAHQIDVYNWFLDAVPLSVTASGGRDYFTQREHYDNVMAIFEYLTPQGPARAFYQVLTTTSSGGGYYESFMGTEGTIRISENPAFTKIYREPEVDLEKWSPLIKQGLLKQDAPAPLPQSPGGAIDVRESAPLAAYDLPVVLQKPAHQPHLENFFAAIRGEAELTCPGEHAYRDEYAIHHVNPAAETRTQIQFKPEDFLVPA